MTRLTAPSRPKAPRAKRASMLVACAGLMAASASACAQVGFAQQEFNGLPVTLIYPTEAKASKVTFGAFEIEVAVDAPLAPAPSGRRNLVVTSHGTAGSALPDHGVAAALARAGFVVAQPLHTGDNWRDASKAGPDAWRTRPAEVQQVIDALAAHPRWGTQLRFDRVGVHGTSAGGVTALSLAGAQWNTLTLLQHCNTHLEADIGFCLTGTPDAAAQAKRRAMYESARDVPAANLPAGVTAWHGGRSPTPTPTPTPIPTPTPTPTFDPRPDARIASVSLAVPVAAIFSAESLARVRVPVGVIAAQADTWLAPRFHSSRVLAHCTGCTVLADLPGATHFDVMHPWPAAVGEEVARRQPRGVATNPAFDTRLRDQAYARVVEFHLQHLRAD